MQYFFSETVVHVNAEAVVDVDGAAVVTGSFVYTNLPSLQHTKFVLHMMATPLVTTPTVHLVVNPARGAMHLFVYG